MFYSVTGKWLLKSVDVHVTPDGAPVSNFTAWLEAKSPEERLALGWYDSFVSSARPGNYWTDEYHIADGVIVQTWADHTPAPRAFQISKLLLRTNLRALGLEDALEGLIHSSATTERDWNDAVTLDSDSPLVLGAVSTFVDNGSLTQEQATDLLTKSRSEYQT